MDELNLIPYELRSRREKRRKIYTYSTLGVLIIVVLALGVLYPRYELKMINYRIKEYQGDSTKNEELKKENQELSNQIANYKGYVDKIDMIKKQKVSVESRLTDIEGFMPQDITLASEVYGNSMITITGYTTNYNSIPIFEAKLETSKKYSSCAIASINQNTAQGASGGIYTFIINLKY